MNTTVALRMTCHAGYCCGYRYHSYKTMGLFPPLLASLPSTFQYCENMSQGRGFQLRFRLIICVVSKVSTTIGPPIFGRQQRATVIAYVVWGCRLDSLGQQLKGGISHAWWCGFCSSSGSSMVSLIIITSSKLYLPLTKEISLCTNSSENILDEWAKGL